MQPLKPLSKIQSFPSPFLLFIGQSLAVKTHASSIIRARPGGALGPEDEDLWQFVEKIYLPGLAFRLDSRCYKPVSPALTRDRHTTSFKRLCRLNAQQLDLLAFRSARAVVVYWSGPAQQTATSNLSAPLPTHRIGYWPLLNGKSHSAPPDRL